MTDGAATARTGGLVGRYAAALYALADDERALDPTVAEMERLGRLIDDSPDFRRLLASPLVDVREATNGARAVLEAEGFSPLAIRFVCVVAANRRLSALRVILRGFAALVAEKRGVITAAVTTAHGLSDVQREQLRARLIEAGYGRVEIEERTDPAILGGLVVRIGARLYDSSLRTRLARLSNALKSNDLGASAAPAHDMKGAA